jgi:hypothetical protein
MFLGFANGADITAKHDTFSIDRDKLQFIFGGSKTRTIQEMQSSCKWVQHIKRPVDEDALAALEIDKRLKNARDDIFRQIFG